MGAPDPAPRRAEGEPDPAHPAGGREATHPNTASPDLSSELEIEKEWLRLAEIDPDRFDRFYDKYHDRIFSFAYWRTRNEDAATDVTAETFLTAWEKRGQFRWQGYTFGAWLFQIARSVISHRQRHEAVRREADFDGKRHEPVAPGTPETELAAGNDMALINACLDRLTEGQREVIILHHFVGLAVRQIAHVTKTPQGTVNSHLRRGKTALRRCLEEHGPERGLSDAALRIIRQAAVDDSGLRVVDGKDEGDA